MPLRAITLDLDDTLWPIRPVLIEAERVLADWLAVHAPATAAHSTVETRAAIREQIGRDHPDRLHDVSFLRREGLRRVLLLAGEDPGLADPAFEVFLAARQRVQPYDEVVPVLARWAERFRLIAVTNGNADVRRTPLAPWFAGAVSAPELGCAKPHPRVFAAACEQARVPAHQVLHIGDDPLLDVAGARAAGLKAAWLRRPEFAHRHTEPAHEGYASLADIDRDLDRLMA